MTVEEDTASWESILPQLTVLLDEPSRVCDEAATRRFLCRAGRVVCRNYAHLQMAGEEAACFDTAAPLSATNGASATWFSQQGARCVWLPDELSLDEVCAAARRGVREGTRAGVLVYGYPQLMVTEHCLLTAEGPCAHSCSVCARRQKERYLVEASGARLPVHIDAHGRTRTFDVCVLDRIENVGELMEAGVSDIAIDATLLDASELECAIRAVAARAASSGA